MEKKESLTEAEIYRQKNTLNRVQTLLDVIYGITIFHLFTFLPKPTQQQLDEKDFFGMFAENGTNLAIVFIGIILIIIYWRQSNVQFGNLARIDAKVATLTIVQMFALLLYLYFMRLDNETDGDEFTLLMESIFMAIAGFIGIYSWEYSRKKGYFDESLTPEESIEMATSFLPEPIVACVTIPLAFIDSGWYMAGWLLLIPVTIYLNRRKKNKIARIKSDKA